MVPSDLVNIALIYNFKLQIYLQLSAYPPAWRGRGEDCAGLHWPIIGVHQASACLTAA